MRKKMHAEKNFSKNLYFKKPKVILYLSMPDAVRKAIYKDLKYICSVLIKVTL